ncbi:MAG: AsmA family protein [Enhydrobacter sp.]|nr:AsmA family protein [Enhydrobacter sp.]
MRIPWRPVIWAALIVVPVVAAGIVLWLVTRDLSSYQARLTEQVRKVTGREITSRVKLSVKIGREPALVAEGVTLSNAPWASRPELARVRRLTMYLDPFSLLLGDAKVGKLLLEGADIAIERNEVGDSNLEMLPPPDGSGPHASENRSLRLRSNPAFPWISTIEVRDSTLTVSEGAGRPPVVLDIARGTFKSTAANQPLQIDASLGPPQATPLELTGTIGSFDGWLRGLPGNIDVQGAYGAGRVAIKGSIGTKGTALQISSEGPDVGVFGPYVRLPVPSGGPYVLNAKVGTQRNGLKVEVPSLKIGASELSGEALFRADRSGTPIASVNIDAAKIDLGGLRVAPAAAAGTGTPPPQRRFLPSSQLQASWLGRGTISVSARFGEVTGLSGRIANGSLSLSSSEKRFALRGAASVGGGSVGFDLVYDPTGRAGQTTLTATASKVAMDDLGALLGLDLGLKDAVGDLDLRLRGGGRNAGGALSSASGVIEFGVGKGVWPADGLVGFPAESMRLLNAGDNGAAFNCLAGRFEVGGGIANLRRLVFDTSRATWIGGGYVSLRNEAWEFIIVPEARDGPGAQLAFPFRIKGGTGRQPAGALEPGLGKLLIGGGAVPSLVGTFNQIARQPKVNACVAMAPRIDGMRPGLRAQLPSPAGDRERPSRRAQGKPPPPPRRQAE